ncbi:hypothetical protein MGYG_08959 [Nannizzia gypsea CBS 118893]|uniref:Uncharacterized protein n=1 Tax=Arthroderma gypseum (strain ATCC MYA-4604 / CBS 118893) TaxID=535722 RepID=E4UPD0_ARTGP|nr:hypothetical protein MGYG_08959 [Nannizzia gypsea CBS 118893]EFQ99019.1 hypothetical protein MGYG_08959 [Nannizzia gypsea CBS 118893]
MEERQTIWDGLPDVEGYISTRHPSSFYKRQHHHEERRAFTTGWMYQASTPTVVDICNILDPGPPPLPPLDTPPWTRSYTTEPFVFLDLNDGSRRTVPLRFQPPPAPQFGGPAHFMTGHGQGWGERGTSEHMFVDEDDDEYMVEVDGEDDGSSVEEIGDAETVMDGHQGPGLRGSFEILMRATGKRKMMRRDRLEFERLGSTVAEIMEYLVEERQGSKREQETGSHHFDGGQTRRPSMDNPHPNPPKSIEDYNTAWKAISESKDISNDQHSVIPWPTSSLRASLLSRHQQQRRGITNHRRLPKEISEDIFQLRKWNAFCFFVQAFGLYPTYIHADGIRRGMSAPEEPREGIVFDIRIQGASRAKLNALKAQMVQDKLRWHPDRLKRHAGGFTGDEEEAAKAVLSAVLDSSKACNRCLELVGRGR